MHNDAAPGRIPVPCSSCRAIVGYVSGKIVERAKLFTGARGQETAIYMQMASDAGAVRCPACERAANPGGR